MPIDANLHDPGDAARLDIAVIGMSGRFPEARSVADYWRNILSVRDCIRRFSKDELTARGVPLSVVNDPSFVPCAPVLPDDPGLFDSEFFGFTPREAELLDPQQRIFLECAWEAIESAGHDVRRVSDAMGVYGSSSISSYLLFNLLTWPELIEHGGAADLMWSNDKDFVSTRVSYELNLRGPSVTVQAACSSSLVAIHAACQGLITYDCDLALAGGVSLHLPQRTGYHFIEGGYASPDGTCRPFDARSQGVVFGSGAGVVLLRRLSDARAAGDTVLAVVRGTAINNDGSGKVGFTAPSVAGQADVIARAQAIAGLDAAQIGYVEAHGTATQLGDLVEVSALRQAFAHVTSRATCALSSVKSNIGHLDAAAGVAGFIKAVLAVRHGIIPPTLHFEAANPRLGLDESPFYVTATPREWKTSERRRAGVSSFGIGGTNAHAVIEQAPDDVARGSASRPAQLLAVSALTEDAVRAATTLLADHIEGEPTLSLADASFTLLTGRKHFPVRRVCVVHDRASAIDSLRDPERMFAADARKGRQVAFLFPGGGSQHAGMAAEIYQSERVFREHVDYCSARLASTLGLDLARVLYGSDVEKAAAQKCLERATFALPALLTIEHALARLWMSWGIQPVAMLGHSVGEYTAAVVADVLSIDDALRVVAFRGALMDELVPGTMLSVQSAIPDLEALLGGDASIAAVNGPEHCVVSGESAAIERLAGRLADRNISFRKLHIQAAAHSPIVEPILARFADYVSSVKFRSPRIPYVSTVTGEWSRDDEICAPSYWVKHLRNTVQFSSALNTLAQTPDLLMLEVGPGQDLSAAARLNLAARTEDPVPIVASLPHALDPQSDLGFMVGAAGRVWAAGGAVDWDQFFTHETRRRIALPTYPFQRRRSWVEPREQAPATRVGGHAKNPNVGEWFHVPAWKQAPRTSTIGALAPGIWVLFDDPRNGGDGLRDALAQSGARVVTVHPSDRFEECERDRFLVRPTEIADFVALFGRLQTTESLPTAIVHRWTLDLDDWRALRERGVEALMNVATATAGAREFTLQVITNRMFDVSGEEPILPDKAVLGGPCLVMPQEFPHLRTQCVDVSNSAARGAWLAGALLEELRGPSLEPKVAYRGRTRWVERFDPAALSPGQSGVREGGVYWITGGLGRVGLRIASFLASRTRGRLVLITRSGIAGASDWQLASETVNGDGRDDAVSRALREISGTGTDAWIVRGDVTDTSRMLAIARETRQRLGSLDAIFHAAGWSGQGALNLISDTTPEHFATQVDAMRAATSALAAVTDELQPPLCILTSSNAAVLGGIGSMAYASAHQFQDAFARRHDGTSGVRWVSVNWDGWPTLEGELKVGRVRTSLDEYVMSPDECAWALGNLLDLSPTNRVVVSTGTLSDRLRTWVSTARDRKPTTTAASVAASSNRPISPPQSDMERQIVGLWEELLGRSPVSANDNFFEIGGNSLVALKVVSRLTQLCGQKVSLTTMFEGPTPRSLATLLSAATVKSDDIVLSQARGESRRARRRARVEASPEPS